MKSSRTRRQFLTQTSLAGLSIWAGARSLFGREISPNERLNIGIIGTAHRAESNIKGVKSENIVAVCDIDDTYLAKISNDYPQAQMYNDFRKLVEQADLDAVVISTADHTHAPATVAALQRGLHVYCEKPLTHSLYEARAVANHAKRAGKATQMGTQIHAGANYRRVVELVRSGAIGPVRACHVWVGKGWGGGERPAETPEIPRHLHWDLWLGPAPERPYHPTYLPANWRRWWDFGGGTIADMGCHFMDVAFWALELRHPTTIEAEGPPVHPETCPLNLIVHYDFPARGTQPAMRLSWYDGDRRPESLLAEARLTDKKNGVLFVGEKGMLYCDYDHRKLVPEEKFAGFQAPAPTIPDSIGHYAEWIKACKTGSPTTCNFDYAGALTETVHLGNIAYRTGKKIEWDAANLQVTNAPEAMRFVRRKYRKGWEEI
jgi:predicted dehydrogenase